VYSTRGIHSAHGPDHATHSRYETLVGHYDECHLGCNCRRPRDAGMARTIHLPPAVGRDRHHLGAGTEPWKRRGTKSPADSRLKGSGSIQKWLYQRVFV